MISDESFIENVKYYWREYNDPTRYMGWEINRCMELMPIFYTAYANYTMNKYLLDTYTEK